MCESLVLLIIISSQINGKKKETGVKTCSAFVKASFYNHFFFTQCSFMVPKSGLTYVLSVPVACFKINNFKDPSLVSIGSKVDMRLCQVVSAIFIQMFCRYKKGFSPIM